MNHFTTRLNKNDKKSKVVDTNQLQCGTTSNKKLCTRLAEKAKTCSWHTNEQLQLRDIDKENFQATQSDRVCVSN